jgi:outer membrane immunogenic protein
MIGDARTRIHEAVMRRLLVVLGLMAAIPTASADEFELPTLRGSEALIPTPPTYTRWRGYYAGAGFSYSSASANFGNSVNNLAAFTVRNTVLESVVANLAALSDGTTNGTALGGFFGYNTQWEGAILGVEVNYNHMGLTIGASDNIPPLLASNLGGEPPGHHFVYSINESASETIRITDIATFRARAGWIAGQFLPYAFVGAAVARADVSRSATVNWTRTDLPDPPNAPLPTISGGGTQSDSSAGGFYWGYAAGLGVDVFLMPNVFVRGEWEYVKLPNVKSVNLNVNSVRSAIGVKF